VFAFVIFLPTHANSCLLEHNRRLYVYEDNMWNIKGRFDAVVANNEVAEWQKDGERLILSILMVNSYLLWFN
jgi:hypothetical protein